LNWAPKGVISSSSEPTRNDLSLLSIRPSSSRSVVSWLPPSNRQYSKKNISPSSLFIFCTPIGLWSTSLFCMSQFRLTRGSSSGKYLAGGGKLLGHRASRVCAVVGVLAMNSSSEMGASWRVFRSNIERREKGGARGQNAVSATRDLTGSGRL